MVQMISENFNFDLLFGNQFTWSFNHMLSYHWKNSFDCIHGNP